MFQIGDSLREARTRRGFSAADVHKAIRIRERYLTALEEERWDMLPGEAYTKGFLRTYAEHLGLNSQLYIDEYNARVARNDEEGPPLVPHATAAEERSVGRGILVALAAIVVVGGAVAGLAAWRLTGSSAPAKSAPPASGAGSVAAAVLPPAATITTMPKPTQHPAVSTRPVLTSITASRGRCWLLVRAGGASGKVLFEGVLEQGTVKQFRFVTKLWVRMGRPDALDITLAGKPVAGLPASPSDLVLTRSGASSA
ncbi:MAG: helix-turn-helix domain-containing protein [Gaiellaceae bacterium]